MSVQAVAMLGLGRMGLPMARHIATAGRRVVAFDASSEARQRAAPVAEEFGFTVLDSAADLAETVAGDNIQLVCSSLPATEHVEAAYLGMDGLAAALAPESVCADLSTISVAASRSIAARCKKLDVRFLDTPVSGTSIHAEEGTLVIMAGGDAEAVATARPVLASFARRIDRVGGNGAGLELKLVTNRLLTTHLAAIAEAVVSLEHTELSVEQGLELLRAGAVPKLLDYKAGPMAERDHRPLFTVDLMAKDLRLADEALAATPLSAAVRALVEATANAGFGEADLGAIIEVIEERFTDGLGPETA